MATILLALPSCKSLDPAIVTSATSTASATTHSHDTLILHDSVYRQDSIIYRERTIHDTVYITKEVYRDVLNSKFLIQNSIVRDTVVDVRVEKEVVQLPPERYVPKFYKRCTIALWAIAALAIGYWAIRSRW